MGLPETSEWQKLVSADPDFDADFCFPPTMLFLDLGAEKPEWELQTAQQLREQAQKGHMSLRAKYRDDKTQD